MTITMILEMECSFAPEDIKSILDEMEEIYHSEDQMIFGNFKKSNSRFIFSENEKPEPIVTEGVNFGWLVGITGSFRCRASSLDEGRQDIENFMRLVDGRKIGSRP
ncbi:hypothetical protein [Xanthomonas oryzae]|uniref:hypothetical protein n=1 Tax=Xanthomonas oryzae TaxID=347 RepID=UPI0011875E53|nr:hypothetical protein [Xanthomonas oryzae]WVN06793.1 hypothetical protein V1208_00910 [Xanthomonas oryzae pv. oryzicola]